MQNPNQPIKNIQNKNPTEETSITVSVATVLFGTS